MGRSTLFGALIFGLLAAVAGYVWVSFEFPFAILLPAAIGWYAIAQLNGFAPRRSLVAALIGGFGFTAVFIITIFVAITDGSPFSIPAWIGAVLAALVAGAATGAWLGGKQGALRAGLMSAAGMLVAVAVFSMVRVVVPSAHIDQPGATQTLYFTGAITLVGAIMGAAIGSATEWIAERAKSSAG